MSSGELSAYSDEVRRVAERVSKARRVACLTGAGISAESGIPTFRGAQGFWAGRRAEELATPEAFARDPEDVWKFYFWRRGLLREKRPNAGHHALAAMEAKAAEFTLITQNVDDLHRLAGSRNVLEVHGNIWIDRCTGCGQEVRRTIEDHSDEIPWCGACGAMMRPGVVWFGEMLPDGVFERAQSAAGNCDVMFVVGTSSVVYPAASLGSWAKANGAFVVEVNPDDTPLSGVVDVRFPFASGAVLPAITNALSAIRELNRGSVSARGAG